MNRTLNGALRALVPLAVLLAAGCGGKQQEQSDVLQHGDALVPISRTLDARTSNASQALRNSMGGAVPSPNGAESFYIALNKKELGQRWFLSAYLKQYFPGAVAGGAAASLGTRVVTFRIQNDKLYVFDASNNYATSDTFDPELVIEAYPIVANFDGFNKLNGSGGYVLFDPSAGLNRFGVAGGLYAAPAYQFQVDLAFMQNFRRTTDGATFEEVFSGYSTDLKVDPTGGQGGATSPYRAQGTLGLALRRYTEGAGYSATEMPSQELYFRSDLHLNKNEGGGSQTAVKWNIHPGMKPIKWLLSDQFLKAQADPAFKNVDIIGAVKRGVENWNSVFGFKALEAQVATANDSFADDETNYIVFDADPTNAYAFADWRTNPNTGEIRGASVYFNAVWFSALSSFSDDAAPTVADLKKVKKADAKPVAMRLTWSGMNVKPLCVLTEDDVRRAAREINAATPGLTKEQKFENYLTHVILHEVGHTLGLRHNFKGSLLPGDLGSSSVMDYLGTRTRAKLFMPGSYDVAAIKYLYGLSSALPTQPFCTDEDVQSDPECNRFDLTDDPLRKVYGPYYQEDVDYILQGYTFFLFFADYDVNDVLKFARAGDANAQLTAWNIALDPRIASPSTASTPDEILGTNLLTQLVYRRLFLDPPDARGDITFDISPDSPVMPLALAQAKAILVNADHIRDYDSRRVMVDVLKKMQSVEALQALTDARAQIAYQATQASGADLALTNDLLRKIDSVTSPYFP